MEKVIKSKSQSQYLSLLVKKISQDRLSLKENESYNLLKMNLDPQGDLEEELSSAWRKAEREHLANPISPGLSPRTSKFSLGNFFRK